MYRVCSYIPHTLLPVGKGQKTVSAKRGISKLSGLKAELISRPLNYIQDYLYPTPSHLLNVSLSDFLPVTSHPKSYSNNTPVLPTIGEGDSPPLLLPQSHHIVYFPSQIPHRFLLPDGTDPDQSPGRPFTRRMWAGGSVQFANREESLLSLRGDRAVCLEGIRDVTIRGGPRYETIIVHIERRIGTVATPCMNEDLKVKYWPTEDIEKMGATSIVERRDLIFMRDKTPERAMIDAGQAPRKICSPYQAEFKMEMTPPPSLLFRFSALTFNAHRIHLDKAYCREVEGHRNLLVHGPLSLVLMLSLLRSRLRSTERIKSFDYRNIVPLYAEEQLTVCGMEVRSEKEANVASKERTRTFRIWIENREGGLAVRGRAIVEDVAQL